MIGMVHGNGKMNFLDTIDSANCEVETLDLGRGAMCD